MSSLPPPYSTGYLTPVSGGFVSVYERFWSKVDVRGLTECWPWTACLCRQSGYGRFGARSALGGPVTWDSHRVSYALTYGPIPQGVEIDHVCHTNSIECVQGASCPHRACVNPLHLELVTHRENALRRESRRRVFKCGHPFEGNRGRAGYRDDGQAAFRCALCHREKARLTRVKFVRP